MVADSLRRENQRECQGSTILFERLLIHPGASRGKARYIEMGRHRPIFMADRRLKERRFFVR